MELKPGEKSYDYSSAPILAAGYCTIKGLTKFLQCDITATKKHMKALGIELTPFVRVSKYVTKAYRSRLRPFTEDEAKAIIKRHRSFQGREFER